MLSSNNHEYYICAVYFITYCAVLLIVSIYCVYDVYKEEPSNSTKKKENTVVPSNSNKEGTLNVSCAYPMNVSKSSEIFANGNNGKYEIGRLRSKSVGSKLQRGSTGKEESKTEVRQLQNKIQNLELALAKHKNIMTENKDTVAVLTNTIQKIQTQRDEATKQIRILTENSGKDKLKEVEKLKSRNGELKSLADALAANLTRKQQSLEEALEAIHSLNEEKEGMMGIRTWAVQSPTAHSHSHSLSLTDVDILESHSHSNVQMERDVSHSNVQMERDREEITEIVDYIH